MKQRILITVGVCILLLGGILIVLHRGGSEHGLPGSSPNASPDTSATFPDYSASTSSANRPVASANAGAPALPAVQKVNPPPTRPPAPASLAPIPLPPPTVALPPPLQGSSATAALDLDKINRMLRDYRTAMGENPVGTNAEIMKAIMGGNPKKANLGPPDGMSLNGSGELVDPWGTPFFFHQLSGTQMEVRSAGPDGVMWTSDDIVQK